jgi:hypothetical protein
VRTTRPRSSFKDTFDGTASGSTRWATGALNADEASQDAEVTVVERNRRLEITPRPNLPGRHFNGYLSAAELDLTGAKVGVEVVQAAADAADTVFAIGVDSNNWYGFVAEGGTLYLQSKVNGSKSPKSVPYSSAQHRFWRFRLDAIKNTVSWETSSDGIIWSSQREEALQLDITALHVTLSAGTYQVTKSPGTAVFDNFSIER